MLKPFTVTEWYTKTYTFYVEAESEEEAINLAAGMSPNEAASESKLHLVESEAKDGHRA